MTHRRAIEAKVKQYETLISATETWFAFKKRKASDAEVEAFHAGYKAAQALLAERDEAHSLLLECLGDYGHPMFTDRHRMADRLCQHLSPKEPAND